MHVTLGYLASKPEDFKICLDCGRLNWHERESCIDCRGERFRPATEEDIEKYLEYRYTHDSHCCDECEVSV